MFTKKKRKKKRKRKKATRLWAGFLAEGDPLPAPQRGEKEPKPAAARALGWAPIPANRPSTWNGNKNTPTYRRLVGRRHPFAGRALLLLACTRIEEKKKKRRQHFLPIAFEIGEHFNIQMVSNHFTGPEHLKFWKMLYQMLLTTATSLF